MALALNQSLTPTKLSSDAPLSPSNYPDKRSMVAAYKRMVSDLGIGLQSLKRYCFEVFAYM